MLRTKCSSSDQTLTFDQTLAFDRRVIETFLVTAVQPKPGRTSCNAREAAHKLYQAHRLIVHIRDSVNQKLFAEADKAANEPQIPPQTL